MPSKFKKAIAVVKDQTSISLAKVGGADSSSLEVAILKATTHDEGHIDERYVTEVLQYVSSNKTYARSCARAIGRRIGRTRNWVVAVKSLMLVLRIFQDGDPHFPKEVLQAMKRGYKILNLVSFRDESNTSCPWDFTLFVRSFALYLDERLDCFLTGKLQRRTSQQQSGKTRGYPRKNVPLVRDMKPGVLLDRISHWQRLLDRAITSEPKGAAKTNRLVQTCLYAVVQETFELYRDISDGLALLIDGFFHLHYINCVSAFQTCVKASKQFEDLGSFHELCKTIGVGVTSEYPTVRKISDELLETLQEYLKDQSSFPSINGSTLGNSISLPPLSPKLLEGRDRTVSEFDGYQSTSLEDLISAEHGFSPDRYSDPGREYPPQCEEDTNSVRSDPTDHRGSNSVLDRLTFDDFGFEIDNTDVSTSLARDEGWELDLFDTSNQNFDTNSQLPLENNYSNPFLEGTIPDMNSISEANHTEGDLFGSFPQNGFGANFPEGGFPGDLGLGLKSENSTNERDHFTSGFTREIGVDSDNYALQPYKADFGEDLSNVSANNFDFPSSFPTDFVALSKNSNGNNKIDSHKSLPVDLFSEFNSYGDPSTFSDSFSDRNVNVSNDTNAIVPLSMENKDDFFSTGNFSAQNVNASNDKNAMVPYSTEITDDFFSPGTFGAQNVNASNDMNAIVPLSTENKDDFFSSDTGFEAAPTFRANSVDIEHQGSYSSFPLESDPFGSITAMTAVEKQQQLWLQNQNKILARHLT